MILQPRRSPHPLVVVGSLMLAGYVAGWLLCVGGMMRPFFCPHRDCRSVYIVTDVYVGTVRTKCYGCGRWHEWQDGVAVDVTNYEQRTLRLAGQ